MNEENLSSKVASLLLQYEAGDFLLLADLSDELKNLKDFYLDKPLVINLIEILIAHTHNEMRLAEGESFLQKLSEGVELIQKLTKSLDDGQKEKILKKIKSFIKPKAKPEVLKKIDNTNIETIQIFIAEAKGRLAKAQDLVLFLEENLNDESPLHELFRIFHTIKGECGFLKLGTLSDLTHNIEHILDELRSKKIKANHSHIELLLEGIDLSKEILNLLEARQITIFNDISLDNYISRLKTTLSTTDISLGKILVSSGKLHEEDVCKILQRQKESAFTKRFGEIAVKENFVSKEDLIEVVDKQKSAKQIDTSKSIDRIDPVIKVKASKVNFLVDMIGELIIALGQIDYDGTEFMQVKKITRTLQNAGMDLRTDELYILFGSIKRAVRDLSRQLSKDVVLETTGEDLEIDRNLIEKLEAPLTHIIRNSLDHGVESAENREELGKNPQAKIELKAERHGNSIVFTVRDDGKGLNRNEILSKAVENKLVTENIAATLSDQQVFSFIFNSGFSTKQEVSKVSGRGVGMDVVQAVVSENRGRIEIDSVQNEFTEIRLIFPLSTAIIDGMITRVNKNNFIFPIGSVIESLKLLPEMISTVNEKVEVATIRGESIPIIRMHKVFNIEEPTPAQIGVICETSDKRKFMFVLDEVLSKREVVIKSLGTKFSNLKGISSGTVLGGGIIGLVVDIEDIIQLTEKELNQ